MDSEGDIISGGGKDGRIVATNPEGEILDETSLPDYVGGARCVAIGNGGTIYVGTTKNSIMKMNFEEEYSTIMQVDNSIPMKWTETRLRRKPNLCAENYNNALFMKQFDLPIAT